MGFSDVLLHLLNFTAPAVFVAVLTAMSTPRLLHRNVGLPGFARLAGACFVANMLVLAAGLWFFGRDGRMATYAVMVLVCGTVAWAMARGWRA